MTEQTISAAFYRGDRQFTVETTQASPPAPGEVAVRIAYCGICGTDMHVFHGNMDARVGFERVIGHEMSGTIAAVGDGVGGMAVGQKVVVRPLDHCGDCPACHAGHEHICHNLKFLGLDTDGAMQEIWNVPAHTIHMLPDDIRMDHAALIEPVAVACHDVRLSRLQAGEDALVIGGGPIGVLVAMVARDAGARVVISEVNPHRLSIAGKLGFDTINPMETDHAQKPEVDMFRFFWRELELVGVRVYEKEDYEKAIAIIAGGGVDADTVITDVSPLSEIQSAFDSLDSSPTALKSLIRVEG